MNGDWDLEWRLFMGVLGLGDDFDGFDELGCTWAF